MPATHEHIDKHGFRLRGVNSTRLDNFSDVVFGFALTILVVSQAVPHTYDELHAIVLGFLPFATCFFLFVNIWLAHYRFFRRYGMHDETTIWLNLILLFTVLFYVYPLKFLFTFAAGTTTGVFTNLYQPRQLMIMYGAGFAAIYLCFAALLANAWKQRLHLHLNPLEIALTKFSFWNCVGIAVIGLGCCTLARFMPLQYSGYAGFGFFLIPFYVSLQHVIAKPHIRRARARLTAADSQTLTPHSSA